MDARAELSAELVAELPSGVVVTDPEAMEKYRFDWSRDATAGVPCAVVRAEDAGQVQVAVRWAARHRVPVVPRGAGSGLSGGSSAVEGGLVLSLERMRAIEIDTDCRVAVVEPGAFNAEVKAAAAEHGLWYPPDPSSYEICSIGGNVATNAGGLCCVKYGVTTDYVLGLDVVLADGTLVTLGGRRIKDVAGLSLLKLFVGSEGTLGIVTRAILRLVPAQAARSTVVASFPTVDAAARAVVSVGRTLRPSMMELMDRASINAVEDHRPMGLDRTAGALLVAQSDAPGAARTEEVEVIRAAFDAAGATEVFATDDPEEGELFVAARRSAFPAIEARGALLLEDVGAPVPRLPDLLAAIATIAEEHDVEIPVVAHAGDGNTHPIVVYDPADPASEKRARLAFEAVMQAAIALGGTITGEHGVGRAKKSALPDQLGPDVMALTRRVKDALDPDGILNPGAILVGPDGWNHPSRSTERWVGRSMRGARPRRCHGPMSTQHIETLIIGAGQAGLSTGYHLQRRGRPFLIVDGADRVGDNWRHQWDTLRLFTPAKYDGLPGLPFPADDPWHFPGKDEVGDYLEQYALHFDLPVRMSTRIESLEAEPGGGYRATFDAASGGEAITCDNVVVATGTFGRTPSVPSFAADLDPGIVQLHSSEYRRPDQLPEGRVLVVGASHSGLDIAYELAESRPTVLCGRDLGQLPVPFESRRARVMLPVMFFLFKHVLTRRTPMGRKEMGEVRAHGGLGLRVQAADLEARGVERVAGRVVGATGGLPLLEGGKAVDAAAVVWCTGFRQVFDWIRLPILGEDGWPREYRGEVADAPGLFFCGLSFQYAFASMVFLGVGRDADFVAGRIASRARTDRKRTTAAGPGRPVAA